MSSNNVCQQNRWSLKGKVFLVTGGTKGIGLATAISIIAHRAEGVVICSRNESDCSKAVIELLNTWKRDNQTENNLPTIKGCACDISTNEGRKKLVQFTNDAFGGRLDGLVNNVGMNVRKNIVEQTEEEYYKMMQTNVDSVYFLCKDLRDLLVNTATIHNSTSVVNVASAAGVQSSGTGAVYGMSKAAVIHFSKILATEWAKHNVRVNAIAPWMTMTPMLKDAIKESPSQLDKVKEWTPMHRIAEIEEIADPITFLLMPCSSFITGQCLGIDGGLTAQGFDGPTITKP
jgi:Tropinone reductase 1